MTARNFNPQINVPSPDPSLATNERLAHALVVTNEKIDRNREESKGWVEALQVLEERELNNVRGLLTEKIDGGIRNIGTRLDGNDTALGAALKAQKEETSKQTENFKEVLGESKKGAEKQIDSLNEKIEDLKKRTFESGGKSQGILLMITILISAIAAIGTIGNFIYIATRISSVPVTYSQPAGNYSPQRQRDDSPYL